MTSTMPVRDMARLVLVAFMWGFGNVAATMIVHDMPPIFAAVVRFFLTMLLLIPYLPIARSQLKSLLPVAMFSGPLHFAFLYTAFSMTNQVGAMTVGGQTWVAFATILSVIFLREQLNRNQIVGLLLAFAGVVVIGGDPQILAELDALGVVILAAFCWGTSAFLARRAGDLPGLTVQAWMAALIWPLLLPVSFLTESGQWASLVHADVKLWSLMAFLVLGSGIYGNVTMFQMVRKYPVTQTTPLLLLTPVFAQIFGYLLLDEVITAKIILGTAITLSGVLVLTFARKQFRDVPA